MKKIILASGSPRRRELMEMIGVDFEVIVSNCKEVLNNELPVAERIMDVARQKAEDVFKKHQDSIVIGCDTVVVVDDEILGKPKSKQQAREMFDKMNNRSHIVLSGVCIISKEETSLFYDVTDVVFNNLSDEEIEEYISSDEPYDKAGGYAIQGKAGLFIREIKGNYYNVMGLPIDMVYNSLRNKKLI